MCGIFTSAHISGENGTHSLRKLQAILKDQNAKRGPDAQNAINLRFQVDESIGLLSAPSKGPTGELVLELYGSELRLRGDRPVVQPHVEGGNVLCWNGEIFDGLEIAAYENDGLKLFGLLCSLNTPEQIRDALSTIEGPYAMVFYHNNSRRLYFARDPLGRRSLLVHRPSIETPYFLLSSVSAGSDAGYEFEEVSTTGIFCLDVASLLKSSNLLQDFDRSVSTTQRNPEIVAPNAINGPPKVNTTIPPDDSPSPTSLDEIPRHLETTIEDFIKHLERSVELRVRNIPQQTPGKARLAVLFSGGIDSTAITYLAHKHVPLSEPIDLLNVAFENPRKINGNVGGISRKRHSKTNTSRGAVPANNFKQYRVPDRVTGMDEVEELRRLCPGRIWNFVEVNVPYEECQAARPMVEALMAPSKTVMDLSLALALYFASRGQGQIRHDFDSEPVPYTSQARVLLNGLGSDELLGGYGRHRTVFGTGGWVAVIEELQLEIDRIPTRNLGRDDRVISTHGKETRHPFLSLSFVSFVASLPIHLKMDPRLPPGFGDKMLLRYACMKLGLVEVSSRKKRAMQFGSHSARMEGERKGDAVIE